MPSRFQDRPVVTASVTPHAMAAQPRRVEKLPQKGGAVNRKALSCKDFRQKGVA